MIIFCLKIYAGLSMHWSIYLQEKWDLGSSRNVLYLAADVICLYQQRTHFFMT
jgi:hypothetical protein